MSNQLSNRIKYDRLFKLLQHWSEFEASEQDDDLERFSVWLNRRASGGAGSRAASHSGSRSIRMTGAEKPARDGYDKDSYFRTLPPASQAFAFLIRLSRFLQFYAKKALASSELESLAEFNLLSCVRSTGMPSKREAIQFCLLETTTGTEAIKRLVKAKLLEEVIDKTDKRAKRLRLSKKGKTAWAAAARDLSSVGALLLGNLSDSEKSAFIESLALLNRFHSRIYMEEFDASLAETIRKNIISSV